MAFGSVLIVRVASVKSILRSKLTVQREATRDREPFVKVEQFHASEPQFQLGSDRLLLRWTLRWIPSSHLKNSNSVVQQPMRIRASCAHPSILDHWALRYMSRCPDRVVSLK
ncbi:hypothetical protein TNCV_3688511 [Trichonephila clavipes]|nr:hypothetical protein TNCV_3688511 [Trichonephila clavipes]